MSQQAIALAKRVSDAARRLQDQFTIASQDDYCAQLGPVFEVLVLEYCLQQSEKFVDEVAHNNQRPPFARMAYKLWHADDWAEQLQKLDSCWRCWFGGFHLEPKLKEYQEDAQQLADAAVKVRTSIPNQLRDHKYEVVQILADNLDPFSEETHIRVESILGTAKVEDIATLQQLIVQARVRKDIVAEMYFQQLQDVATASVAAASQDTPSPMKHSNSNIVPPSFRCPVSGEVMERPVVIVASQASCDSSSLEKHLTTAMDQALPLTCPVSGKALQQPVQSIELTAFTDAIRECHALQGAQADVPPSFKCPVFGRVMERPIVVVSSQAICDCSSLDKHLTTKLDQGLPLTCPVSGKELKAPVQFIDLTAFGDAIKEWHALQDQPLKELSNKLKTSRVKDLVYNSPYRVVVRQSGYIYDIIKPEAPESVAAASTDGVSTSKETTNSTRNCFKKYGRVTRTNGAPGILLRSQTATEDKQATPLELIWDSMDKNLGNLQQLTGLLRTHPSIGLEHLHAAYGSSPYIQEKLTLLQRAAYDGNYDAAVLLLNNGARVDTINKDEQTALHIAVYFGHLKLVKLLISKGAVLQATDKNGWTALHVACVSLKSSEAMVKLLLDHKAPVNAVDKIGGMPLHAASHKGSTAFAQMLLDNGAIINAVTSDGWTPLHHAAHQGCVAVAKLLLDNGASVDARAKDGWTPLQLASHHGYVAVAGLLLEYGASLYASTEYGWTSLHVAARGGHVEVVQLLLDRGLSPTAVTKDGWAALHVASHGGCNTVVKLLLENGVPVRATTNDGRTALHLAAHQGHVAVAQLLLDNNASLSATDKDGWTPLHYACQGGSEAVVKLLLDREASVDVTSKDGETPLKLAERSGNQAVLRLLQEPDVLVQMRGLTGFRSQVSANLSEGALEEKQTKMEA